jgi:hypothetical protein
VDRRELKRLLLKVVQGMRIPTADVAAMFAGFSCSLRVLERSKQVSRTIVGGKAQQKEAKTALRQAWTANLLWSLESKFVNKSQNLKNLLGTFCSGQCKLGVFLAFK